MTENKRFIIKESTITDGCCIFDTHKEYAFVPVDKKAQLESTCKTLNALYEENLQLKNNIKEVKELLSEEVDLFSDKATEHDIQAYIELKEFDNKDAYYMATATKEAIKILKGCLND